jgi:nucleoid DNA-binding protein
MKKEKGGKSSIVKDLMATGLTARKAEAALNAVLDSMKFALWCGEPVEVPGGTIQTKIRQGKPRRKWQKFRHIQTGQIAHTNVHYPGWRMVVKFSPDINLDLTPLPRPPLPDTTEQAEVRQLASELLGEPADNVVIAKLQEAVEVHPFKPGSLLRRLQEFKSRGWRFDNDVHSLARQVAAQHWL